MTKLDLSLLNRPQREAVLHAEGPLLVLAGAGSGKTRVIAHRVVHLIERGVPPATILAVTFTNKAAAEMRQRVAKLRGRTKGVGPEVSTFHAFGYSLVKRFARELGLGPRLAVADSSDQLSILKQVLKQVQIDDRKFDTYRLLALISTAKGEGRAPEPLAEGRGDDYDLAVHLVFDRYQRSLRAMGMVDFDDLLALPVQLLTQDPARRALLQAEFRHLLVDEYQDTNALQLKLLKLLVAPPFNLCAVGDDDQSIYGWRGAVLSNILGFERHFPGAREVRLTQNYRSTGAILKCANAVIRENPNRKDKELWTDRGDGDLVEVITLPGEDEEARFVAERIAELRTLGRPLQDIAVLFRTNAQSRPFEEALRSADLPYDVVGGPSFFERKEVRDLVAYLKLCANPDDEVALLRIVNVPARGIGEASIDKLRARAMAEQIGLRATLAQGDRYPELAQVVPKLAAFLALLDELRQLFRTLPLGAAARALIERVGLGPPESEQGAGRARELLEYVCRSLDEAQTRSRDATLPGWLSRLALDGRHEEAAPGDGGRCVLMTLHAVKGLEFPVVFLVGLEEGLLPHGGMQGQLPDLEEERRLCYVGITRAREKLTLTHAAGRERRGSSVPRTPSRFLAVLPAAQARRVNLAAPAQPMEPRVSKFWTLVADGGGEGNEPDR